MFLVDVAVLVLASHLPAPWWAGAPIAGVVTIVSVFTYRGIALISALAAWAWDWSSVPEAALLAGHIPAIDHQRRFGRDVVGVHEYQGQLVAVIAVDARADAPSGRHSEISSATMPVEVVAAGLRQFDVRLDAIDIVSVWTRHVAEAADPSALDYAQVANDAPTHGRRSTWLVLRMNPQHNVAAVAARDSVASTMAAAAERLANDLDGRHYVGRPLTGVELAEVASAALAGLQPAWNRPGWRYLKHLNGYVSSFWVSAQDIARETLERLWLPDTDATVVTIRVTAPPRPGGGIGLGPLSQHDEAPKRCLDRAESAHRPPVGRGACQPAGPYDAPPADGAGAGAARRRTAAGASWPSIGWPCVATDERGSGVAKASSAAAAMPAI